MSSNPCPTVLGLLFVADLKLFESTSLSRCLHLWRISLLLFKEEDLSAIAIRVFSVLQREQILSPLLLGFASQILLHFKSWQTLPFFSCSKMYLVSPVLFRPQFVSLLWNWYLALKVLAVCPIYTLFPSRSKVDYKKFFWKFFGKSLGGYGNLWIVL